MTTDMHVIMQLDAPGGRENTKRIDGDMVPETETLRINNDNRGVDTDIVTATGHAERFQCRSGQEFSIVSTHGVLVRSGNLAGQLICATRE